MLDTVDKSGLTGSPFKDFRILLQRLVAQYPEARVMELGAGRMPAYALSEMPDNIGSMTVNDIDQNELDLAGPEYDRACFDVLGDVSAFAGQYDVVYSKTLIEHVRDGRLMHSNILKLLKPGGVALHLCPTLYSPPFVLNRLMPEEFSRKLLWTFFPDRKDHRPKFPAHYSWCFGNREKMSRMLREVGYSDVEISTYYGHGYFKKVPGIRELDQALTNFARKRDISSFGSFAHIVAYK